MTEALSFGANGCGVSYQCNQEFLTDPQQNKGRITNLIINQTKMTKIRDLIEKIWWVIPPIFIVFGIPLYNMLTYPGLNHYDILMVPGTFISFGFLGGIILITFFFGFMGYGYYLVRKQSSLLRRIIIVSVLGIIGFFAGTILMSMMGAY